MSKMVLLLLCLIQSYFFLSGIVWIAGTSPAKLKCNDERRKDEDELYRPIQNLKRLSPRLAS